MLGRHVDGTPMSLPEILAENHRIMEETPKGTEHEPVVRDPRTMKTMEKYAVHHLHDLTGKCIKNRWWRTNGFCHEKEQT